MRIVVRRTNLTADGILGSLEVDGKFNCFSLENRALAILAGTYSVELTYSPDFHRVMPLIDVGHGRTAIRLHPANWPTQLKGCIAVGLSHDADDLNNSDQAFEPLLKLISDAIDRKENVSFEVVDIQSKAPAILPQPQPASRPGILAFLDFVQTWFSRLYAR